jgi:hypothetical protein
MLESTAFGFSVHPAQTSFGDAGGPVVVQTAGGARIAGIIASTTAEERSIRVSALLSGFLAPLLSLAVGIDSVTVEPERPVAGYPFTVTTRLTRTTTQDTLLELRLIALENAAEFSVPLTQVIIPIGSDHMNVEVPGMVMGGHSYVVAARFGDSSMKSATFTARPHATIASMTVAPAVVAPLSQFTLTVVLAAPVAEPIVIPIDVTFPAGDMTTIAIPSNHTRPRPSSRPRSDPQPAS